MNYFITGGSGFIGRRLIKKLFQQHPDCTVYFLMRASHQEKLTELFSFWNVDESRAVPVFGDMTQPLLGVSVEMQEQLLGKIDHFFHLAAIYDLNAKAGIQQQVNTEGTRQSVQLAERLAARHPPLQLYCCSRSL